MRVRRQIKQEILADQWRKIDSLWPAELRVQGKRRHLNPVHKFLQTRNATQFHRLRERSARPQRAIGDADVDLVTQQPGATNVLGFQFFNRAILFAFEMQTFWWNLFQMNSHARNLSELID